MGTHYSQQCIFKSIFKDAAPLKGQEYSTGTQSRVDQFCKLTAAFWTLLGPGCTS